MPNIALTGKSNCEIDGAFLVTLTRFSSSKNIPTVVKKGNAGTIGIAQGVPDVSGTFTFAMPSLGPETDLDAWEASDTGRLVVFRRGAQRIAISGCKISGIDDSNDPGAGNYEITVKFTGAEMFRTA